MEFKSSDKLDTSVQYIKNVFSLCHGVANGINETALIDIFLKQLSSITDFNYQISNKYSNTNTLILLPLLGIFSKWRLHVKNQTSMHKKTVIDISEKIVCMFRHAVKQFTIPNIVEFRQCIMTEFIDNFKTTNKKLKELFIHIKENISNSNKLLSVITDTNSTNITFRNAYLVCIFVLYNVDKDYQWVIDIIKKNVQCLQIRLLATGLINIYQNNKITHPIINEQLCKLFKLKKPLT